MNAADMVCADLARLLAERGCRVDVRALGVRDELAASGPPAEYPVVYVYGHHALLGPGTPTGCPTCLARRWQCVRHKDLRDALELGGDTEAAGRSPYATQFAAELLRNLIEARRSSSDVHHVDLQTLQVRRFGLVPDGECPSCGDPADDAAALAVVPMDPAPKPQPTTFRSRSVDGYPIALDAYANPFCGALGATVWHDTSSLSTSPAIGSFTLRTGRYLRETLYGGHADSYLQSGRVAVLEGLERAAGLRPRGKRTTVVAGLAQLGEDAVDPRRCGLYHEDFYQANPYVHRFDPERPIPWVWGWSLRDQRPVLVPEILVYYHTGPVDERFVQETSNGCASGSSLVEAAYHGLMEVVERDAFLLAWYGGRALPEIDPATVDSARVRMMADRLAMYGYRARFFDARITFAVPVVAAVAVRDDGGLGALAFGAGASLDPYAAIDAALCEIATDSVMVRTRAGADEARLRSMVDDFARVQGLHDHPLLYGLPEMVHHAAFLLDTAAAPLPMGQLYAERPPLSDDLRDDLAYAVQAMAAQGFDVIVVDQTMPEQRALGVHAVSVLVPGLLPIDFGWLRQRAPHSPRLRELTPGEIHAVPHPFP